MPAWPTPTSHSPPMASASSRGDAPSEGALDRALEIDAELAQAYACRGCVRSVYDWAWTDAERDFRKAIALQPGYPTAHHWYAINHLVPLGRFVKRPRSCAEPWRLIRSR